MSPSNARSILRRAVVALLLLLFTVTLGACRAPSEKGARGPELLPDLASARALSAETGRPTILIFGALWCASCRTFKAETLPSAETLSVAPRFVWVGVDIDHDPLLARSYGVEATPHLFVLDGDGEVAAELQGALSPTDFRRFLVDAERRALGDAEALLAPRVAEDVTRIDWSESGFRAGSICFSQVGYGLLRVPSQSPASVLRLAPKPRTPSTLAEGQTEVAYTNTLSNYFANEPGEYRLDYGALYTSVSVAHGLTNTVQLELDLIDFRRFDSILDPLTDAFHDLVGLDDAGRDDFGPRANVIEAGGTTSVDDSTYVQDLALTVQHNVTCGTETVPAFSYAATVRTNFAGNIPARRDPDLSFALSAASSKRFGDRWYGYLGLGFAWHGLDRWRGIDLVRNQYSALGGVEWRFAARASFVLQYLLTEAVSATTAPFDDPTHEISLGWKWELPDGIVAEVGLLENAFVVDNSPDVGIHVGLSKRY